MRREIDAPAARVWEVIADFGGLEKWATGVDACQVEGEGVGAVRTLRMGALSLQERLESHDARGRSFSYAIVGDTPLPFTEYLSTVRVSEPAPGRALVDWRGRFRPTGDEAAAANIVRGIYAGSLAALGKHLGAAVREPAE